MVFSVGAHFTEKWRKLRNEQWPIPAYIRGLVRKAVSGVEVVQQDGEKGQPPRHKEPFLGLRRYHTSCSEAIFYVRVCVETESSGDWLIQYIGKEAELLVTDFCPLAIPWSLLGLWEMM